MVRSVNWSYITQYKGSWERYSEPSGFIKFEKSLSKVDNSPLLKQVLCTVQVVCNFAVTCRYHRCQRYKKERPPVLINLHQLMIVMLLTLKLITRKSNVNNVT